MRKQATAIGFWVFVLFECRIRFFFFLLQRRTNKLWYLPIYHVAVHCIHRDMSSKLCVLSSPEQTKELRKDLTQTFLHTLAGLFFGLIRSSAPRQPQVERIRPNMQTKRCTVLVFSSARTLWLDPPILQRVNNPFENSRVSISTSSLCFHPPNLDVIAIAKQEKWNPTEEWLCNEITLLLPLACELISLL